MLNNSSNNVLSENTAAQSCNCYKKLDLLGIPLYLSEEAEYEVEYGGEYDESNIKANAFQIPTYVRINESVTVYPVVDDNETFFVFQVMAKVIPCLADFELNVLSFWMLDVFIEGLKTAQNAQMSHEHQKATLKWIAYFFNYLKDRNPTRRGLFNQLKRLLFLSNDTKDSVSGETIRAKSARETVVSNETRSSESDSQNLAVSPWQLPLPPSPDGSLSEDRISESSSDLRSTSDATTVSPSFSDRNFKTENPRENLMDMKIIVEILYRIFGRFWTFLEIQTALNSMPSLEKVNLPFTLNIPKPMKPEPPPSPTKTEKPSKKTAVVLEKSPEEIEAERQEHRNDYILPLQESEEAKLYLKEVLGISSNEKLVPEKGKNKK